MAALPRINPNSLRSITATELRGLHTTSQSNFRWAKPCQSGPLIQVSSGTSLQGLPWHEQGDFNSFPPKLEKRTRKKKHKRSKKRDVSPREPSPGRPTSSLPLPLPIPLPVPTPPGHNPRSPGARAAATAPSGLRPRLVSSRSGALHTARSARTHRSHARSPRKVSPRRRKSPQRSPTRRRHLKDIHSAREPRHDYSSKYDIYGMSKTNKARKPRKLFVLGADVEGSWGLGLGKKQPLPSKPVHLPEKEKSPASTEMDEISQLLSFENSTLEDMLSSVDPNVVARDEELRAADEAKRKKLEEEEEKKLKEKLSGGGGSGTTLKKNRSLHSRGSVFVKSAEDAKIRLGDTFIKRKELNELQSRSGLGVRKIESLAAQFLSQKESLDVDLTKQEFYTLAEKVLSISNPVVLHRLFDVFDLNGDGSISFREFAEGMNKVLNSEPEDKLKFLFQLYDVDGSGSVSMDEIVLLLKTEQDDLYEYVTMMKNVMNTIDEDGDGEISLEEFIEISKKEPVMLEFFTHILPTSATTQQTVTELQNDYGLELDISKLESIHKSILKEGVSTEMSPPIFSRVVRRYLDVHDDIIIKRLFRAFDENGDGTVNLREFLSGLSTMVKKGAPEDKMRFMFKLYDVNGDGNLSANEIMQYVFHRQQVAEQDVQQVQNIMQSMDTDGDGTISFEEYMASAGSHPVLLGAFDKFM